MLAVNVLDSFAVRKLLALGAKKDFNATELFNSAEELMSHWVVE